MHRFDKMLYLLSIAHFLNTLIDVADVFGKKLGTVRIDSHALAVRFSRIRHFALLVRSSTLDEV